MRKSPSTTYVLRRRGLPNFRNRTQARAELEGFDPSPAAPALTAGYERQRINFEQRRLEHLRESWRVQGAS